MNLQLGVVHELKCQVAIVGFVKEILELLEKESPPVVHFNCKKE
jgi:hypothetical protein